MVFEELNDEDEQYNLGEPLLNWEVDEYTQHDRSRTWYVVAAALGVGLIVYSIATANFLFAVIILMIGVITLLSSFKAPERVPIVVTTTGVIIDDTFYDYESIKFFSVIYEPPHVNTLYLDFNATTHPLISIPLEKQDPNIVREHLLPFCTENLSMKDETLTDILKRVYKL